MAYDDRNEIVEEYVTEINERLNAVRKDAPNYFTNVFWENFGRIFHILIIGMGSTDDVSEKLRNLKISIETRNSILSQRFVPLTLA
jgi:hypothetical protein